MCRYLTSRLCLWLIGIISAIVPTLTFAQKTAPADSQWGPWTSWSACSRTCGTGLAYRLRHCHRSSDSGAECQGLHKQHQVCSTQNCTVPREDYRSVECRKHNSDYYAGRRYEWEAFINPYARCELACKAQHHHYYARFKRTVEDGTKCKRDKNALCLAGECLDVGCDGILGSGAVVDQCGICGGDGATCRVISGIFMRTHLAQHGYHHVTTIPTGACNINITELAPSRNYLALTTSAGSSILNGDKQMLPLGQYEGAGTSFDYRRRSGTTCPGVCIFADGPLKEPVEVKLLYYERNPGIMYHFTVPQDTAAAVMSAVNSTHSRHHHGHHHHHHKLQRPPHHHHQHTAHSRLGTHQDLSNTGPEEAGSKDSEKHAVLNPRQQDQNSPGEKHKMRDDSRLALSLTAASDSEDSTTDSLGDEPFVPRTQQLRQRGPYVSGSKVESPSQPRSSSFLRRANLASAPHFVPPEKEGAPIEYRHYYHINSDDYRRLSQTAGYAALNSGQRLSGDDDNQEGGAEALYRPNIIPATREAAAQRSWGLRHNSIDSLNSVGDVPLSVPASGYFVWTIAGFSSCSEPCGGGVQQTVVVCMKSDTRVVVMAENCDLSARPSPTTVECNTQPCSASWTEESWSDCSVSCGHGVQTRTVECKQRISPTLYLSVSADRCVDQKPPVTQFCRQPPCFQWRTSNWTKCSTDCGLGERTRMASCVNGEGEVMSESLCNLERPKTREICDMGSCASGWYYTNWSHECTPECGGKAHKTRKVHCAAEDGAVLPGDRCPTEQKPRTHKPCGTAKPCGGKWFAGPWSQCNSSCGEAWRKRDVTCMKKHGHRLWGVVSMENCLRKERPISKEQCTDLPPCQPEWYMTHWTECSKSCDTGSKTREVKCLDSVLQPSLSCSAEVRPQERKACNKHSCGDLQLQTNDYDVRPGLSPPHQRYHESTSPNATYHHYHSNQTRQPAAVRLAAPAEISLQQDIRNALGDPEEDHTFNHHHTQEHHHLQPNRQHKDHHAHMTTGRTTEEPNSITEARQTATQSTVSENCTDKPNGRWCLFVSQARLCRYLHYKKQCCHTCSK